MLEKIGRMFGGQGLQSNPQWYYGGGGGVGGCFGGRVSSREWRLQSYIIICTHFIVNGS